VAQGLFPKTKLELKFRIFIGVTLVVLSFISWWWIVRKEESNILAYGISEAEVIGSSLDYNAVNQLPFLEQLTETARVIVDTVSVTGETGWPEGKQERTLADPAARWRIVILDLRHPLSSQYGPQPHSKLEDDRFEQRCAEELDKALKAGSLNPYRDYEARVVVTDAETKDYQLQFVLPLRYKPGYWLHSPTSSDGTELWKTDDVVGLVSVTFDRNEIDRRYREYLETLKDGEVDKPGWLDAAGDTSIRREGEGEVAVGKAFGHRIPVEKNKTPGWKIARTVKNPSVKDTVKNPSVEDGYLIWPFPADMMTSCAQCHADLSTGDPSSQVVLRLPMQEKILYLRTYKVLAFVLLLMTVVITLSILYILVRYVTIEPLVRLTDVLRKVQAGDLNARADVKSNDELELFAESFNKMVSTIKETHENLQRVNDELESKVNELGIANLKLFEMNKIKEEFLANVGHELRTPLNSILGFSQLLSERVAGELNEKQARYVEFVNKSGRDLLDLINDMLDLSKMESGKYDVQPDYVSISSIVESVVATSSPELKKGKELVAEVEPNMPLFVSDKVKLLQILLNLISNALKFTPEGGKITVRVSTEDEHLVLSVSDTGIGIKKEDQEVIFEKFRQVDGSATRRFGGVGLGLAIVSNLVTLLKGTITVDSELGKGSTFTVRLPIYRRKEDLPPDLRNGLPEEQETESSEASSGTDSDEEE